MFLLDSSVAQVRELEEGFSEKSPHPRWPPGILHNNKMAGFTRDADSGDKNNSYLHIYIDNAGRKVKQLTSLFEETAN